MKRFRHMMLSVALLATALVSCEKDDNKVEKKEYDKVAYIVNYGGYSKGNGEISTYDIAKAEISNDSYNTANEIPFTSNIESMSIYNDVAYFMSNAGDKIDIVDAATLEALGNPVSADITKPRFFAAEGNTGYISCWGEVNDWAVYANSYIAKMDLSTKAITKIELAGGPEGLIIKNNKLYISSSTANKVTVMDLATDTFTTIEVPAIPQQFVEDANGNLWVSLVSKYSVPFSADKLGFAIIDVNTDKVVSTVKYEGMGSNGFIHASPDKKTIYVLGGGNYVQDANGEWIQLPTGISTVDISSKVLGDAIITGDNFNGFNVDPANGDIYVLVSPSNKEPGILKIYDSKGAALSEKVTGTSPKHVVFYDIEKE